MSENVLPIFSSRSFNGSCFMFKSLSHFEFIFIYKYNIYCERVCSNFTDSHALFTFPNTTWWRDHLFPVVYFHLHGGSVAFSGDQPPSWSCLGAPRVPHHHNSGVVRGAHDVQHRHACQSGLSRGFRCSLPRTYDKDRVYRPLFFYCSTVPLTLILCIYLNILVL